MLNTEPFDRGSVLVAGPDFGTGSSREHAVWALTDYGFRVVISSRFADIFRGNSAKAGLLAAEVAQPDVELLWKLLENAPGTEVTVDLTERTVQAADLTVRFDIDDYTRWRLLEGLDDIGLTLRHADEITQFEATPSGAPARHHLVERRRILLHGNGIRPYGLQTMNKSQLIDALAARLGDRRTAASAVDGLLSTIVETVKSGESVSLTGFGVFEARARAARVGRNPRTGQTVAVPAATVPAFRPGIGFKAAVGGVASAPAPRAARTRAAEAAAAVEAPAKPAKATRPRRRARPSRPKAKAPAAEAPAAKAANAKAAAAKKAEEGHQGGRQGRPGRKKAKK